MRQKRGTPVHRTCVFCGGAFTLGAHHRLHKYDTFDCRRLAALERDRHNRKARRESA